MRLGLRLRTPLLFLPSVHGTPLLPPLHQLHLLRRSVPKSRKHRVHCLSVYANGSMPTLSSAATKTSSTIQRCCPVALCSSEKTPPSGNPFFPGLPGLTGRPGAAYGPTDVAVSTGGAALIRPQFEQQNVKTVQRMETQMQLTKMDAVAVPVRLAGKEAGEWILGVIRGARRGSHRGGGSTS